MKKKRYEKKNKSATSMWLSDKNEDNDTKRRNNQPCLHVAALALDRVHALMGAHLLGQGELAVVDVNSDDVPGRNLV